MEDIPLEDRAAGAACTTRPDFSASVASITRPVKFTSIVAMPAL
jgi:hypothetical protein